MEDQSELSSYFNRPVKYNRSNGSNTKTFIDQSDEDALPKSTDDLLRLVIIEHFLREGLEFLAIDLMNVCLNFVISFVF